MMAPGYVYTCTRQGAASRVTTTINTAASAALPTLQVHSQPTYTRAQHVVSITEVALIGLLWLARQRRKKTHLARVGWWLEVLIHPCACLKFENVTFR